MKANEANLGDRYYDKSECAIVECKQEADGGYYWALVAYVNDYALLEQLGITQHDVDILVEINAEAN